MRNRHASHLFALSLLLTLPFWFNSCKKNDDSPSTQAATIGGSYKINALKINPSASGLSDLIAAQALLGTTCLTDLVITFNTDGSATTNNPTSCQTLSTVTSTPVSTFTGIDASSKWTQSGTVLTVTKGDGTKTNYTVVSNTGSVVQLQWQGLFNYPVASTTMYTFTMELRKQ